MKIKRTISLILCLTLIFTICGCTKKENNESGSLQTTEKTKQKTELVLLYSASDGFNPYTAKTETNKHLLKLLFEPLVKTDNNFNPINTIAKKVSVKGKSCTVSLKDVTFSDGTQLTADDVIYSYNLAKGDKDGYKSNLYNITSARKKSQNTVVFSLKKHDRYCANVLTFPIIKKKSDTKTDSDGVLLAPVGSGKFTVNKTMDALVKNENNTDYSGSIKTVRLVNAPDIESVTHYAQIGAADLYYSDISTGSITRLTGEKIDINLNNMVYIGINQNYGALKNNLMRQIISSALDRAIICQNTYFNNAVAATGFFSPVWKEVKSVQNIQNKTNKEITIENLEKIGYNRLDSNGKRVNSNGKPLNFTLLVNSDNAIKVSVANTVASQLKAFGIGITVIKKPYKQYLKAIKKNKFQLYVGEIKLTDNMDISSMVTKGGSAAYGLKKLGKKQKNPFEVVDGFYNGKNSITDVASVLQSQMPFVPICYRTATLFYNDKIENVNTASLCDIYLSINSYIYKIRED